jgi:hypothetical protein
LIPSGGEPAARRHASDVLDRLAADPNDKFVMPSATAVRRQHPDFVSRDRGRSAVLKAGGAGCARMILRRALQKAKYPPQRRAAPPSVLVRRSPSA